MDMTRVKDLTGRQFGRWTVLRFSHAKGRAAYWWCQCGCAARTERPVFGGDLKRGVSTSCGCHMREQSAERLRRHSMSRHPAYRSWQMMRNRCANPAFGGYDLYGGRGITVCAKWDTFEGFWEDMGPTWAPGLSIDRYPDKDGNYGPDNCRWATPRQQARNRRTERLIQTPDGEMSVTAAAEKYGIPRPTLFSRLRYGWTDPSQLLAPPRGTCAKQR